MDAGLFDSVDLGNGTGEFPLESPLVVEFLNKLGHTEVLAVKYLETDPPSLGEAFGGHCEAQFVNLVGRDQNALSISSNLVGGLGVLQLFDYLTRIFGGKIGKQGTEIRPVGNEDQDGKSQHG